jgi:hypothetical protein
MKKYLCIVVLICICPLLFWLLNFWEYSISINSVDWANFGNFIGGTLSPILAFASFIGLLLALKEQRRDIDTSKNLQDAQAFYEQGVKCLKRAFEEISENETLTEPKQDRLAWLTTARLILTALEFYESIPSDVSNYKLLFKSEAEDWRQKFYTFFRVNEKPTFSMSKSYFSELDERSIKVIYSFIEWPKDLEDPIEKVVKYTDAEISKLHVGQIGLKQFLLEKRHKV